MKIYDRANGTYVPLDESKTYALAGMNYTLRNLGDGFAMFDGATLIKDYVSEDYLVMSSYAAMFGGVDANGLPHLASANSPLADYPGYLAGLRESLPAQAASASCNNCIKMGVPSQRRYAVFV